MSESLSPLSKKSNGEQITLVALYNRATVSKLISISFKKEGCQWFARYLSKYLTKNKRFALFCMLLTVVHSFSPFLCSRRNRSSHSSLSCSFLKSDKSNSSFANVSRSFALLLFKKRAIRSKYQWVNTLIKRGRAVKNMVKTKLCLSELLVFSRTKEQEWDSLSKYQRITYVTLFKQPEANLSCCSFLKSDKSDSVND